MIFFLYELDGLPKLPCIKIYVLSCVEIGICYYLQHFKKFEIKVYMLALSGDLKDIILELLTISYSQLTITISV